MNFIQNINSGNKKKNTCHVCGEDLMWLKSLREHIAKVHEDIRSFKCQLCDKAFIIKGDLEAHMTIMHTGKNKHPKKEKKIKCDTCGKYFTDNGKLGEHMNTHTGEKPFKCQYCGVGFSNRSNHRKHEQSVHHGIKRK